VTRWLALLIWVAAAWSCSDNSAEPPREFAPPPTLGSKGGLKGGEPAAPPTVPKR